MYVVNQQGTMILKLRSVLKLDGFLTGMLVIHWRPYFSNIPLASFDGKANASFLE